MPEQRRIAALLEKVDRLRRTRRYARQLSDTFLQSVFLDMFGNPNCERRALEELAIKKRGSFVNGPFGSNLLTRELVPNGVPVIYIRDISEARYQRVSAVCVTPDKAEELKICQAEGGDVLVAKVGDPPGTAAIYPRGEPVGVITQDVIRIKLNLDLVTPEYLVNFFNSKRGFDTLKPIIVEGTRSRFGLTPFKELPIPTPPLPLQQKFADIVRRFERLRAQQREAERQAEHLFQTLLHRAFKEGM